MPVGRVVHSVGHLRHRPLEVFTHPTDQCSSVDLLKPIHGNTPSSPSGPEHSFKLSDGKIGRPSCTGFRRALDNSPGDDKNRYTPLTKGRAHADFYLLYRGIFPRLVIHPLRPGRPRG